ncbi:MAG: ribosome assembly cofactor RimP [Muribaculaceae bacterium]|nr:ribosome assembly cofactor RimP [Muribaculaceae bacterium]
MIDKSQIKPIVEQAIEGTDIYLVDLRVEPGNRIVVELDSADGMDVDSCAGISRKIEATLDRDKEDFELEVGSAGLTAPFKVRQQYLKNIGNEIEVLTKDGRKLKGTLTAVNPDDYVIEIPVKEKAPGAKRPTVVMKPQTIPFDLTKIARYVITFK